MVNTPFLNNIIESFDSNIAGESPLKFLFLSAHDENIAAV